MPSCSPGQPLPRMDHSVSQHGELSASVANFVSQTDNSAFKPSPDFHRTFSLNIHYTGKKLEIPCYSYNIRNDIKLGHGQHTLIVPTYTPRCRGIDCRYSRLDHVEVLSGKGQTSSDIEKQKRDKNMILAEELPRFTSALLNKCDEIKDFRNGKRDRDIAVSKLRSNNLKPEDLEDARKSRNQYLQEHLYCRLYGVKSVNDLTNQRKLKNESLSEIVSKDDKLVSLERILHEEKQKENECLSDGVRHKPTNLSEVMNNKLVKNRLLSEEQALEIEFISKRFQSRMELSTNRQRESVAMLKKMYYPNFDENYQTRRLMNEKLHGVREEHLNEIAKAIPGSEQRAARRNKVAVAQLISDDKIATDLLNVKSRNNIKLSEELANNTCELQNLEQAEQQRRERNCMLLDVIPESNLPDASETRKVRYGGVLEILFQQTKLVESLAKEGDDKRRKSNELLSENVAKTVQLCPLSSMERNHLLLEEMASSDETLGTMRLRSEEIIEERKRRNQDLSNQTTMEGIQSEKDIMRRLADIESVKNHE